VYYRWNRLIAKNLEDVVRGKGHLLMFVSNNAWDITLK